MKTPRSSADSQASEALTNQASTAVPEDKTPSPFSIRREERQEDEIDSEDDREAVDKLRQRHDMLKEGLERTKAEDGIHVELWSPAEHDIYTPEYLEELYGGKHRSYDTYDKNGRRVRVKHNPDDTWIKVTQHNVDHVRTSFAKDRSTGDWECVERHVPINQYMRLSFDTETCIMITMKPEIYVEGWAYSAMMHIRTLQPESLRPRIR